jgi:hypothetical protein
MRHLLCFCALAALVFAGCRTAPSLPGPPTLGGKNACADPILNLDRGQWRVSEGSRVWKAMAASAANRPPHHIGYVEERTYRELRGGPRFAIRMVTTRNRKEQIGHIDQLGRAVRYEPQRNGTFTEVAIAANTLEQNVGAIFDTRDRITLVPTTERRLAFEAIDLDGDGLLQSNETRDFGDRIAGADSNRDGVVDFEEFDAIDVL